ncbi:phenylacetate--CoA ligase family protein [Wolinella succinogenes]|uniref:phenylacetate--CoA ligase family protein n=1 Tax=Wolinella succinogenes TaxID=844 RepID=UPI001696DCA4|nr:phenylacetate--CoA ligase [Wolinella succinogenes]NLU34893.1 phenylacetate--CoA ligase [Wolinella succinogenes]
MVWNDVEAYPREKIQALQLSRLQETLRRVYELVPFYRAKFDEIGITPDSIQTLQDISRLPFTKKQDLRNNYPFGLFSVSMDEVVRIHSSSGTTGKPTVVGYTKHDMEVWGEVMARTFTLAGVTAKDVVHNAYGYGLFTGGLGFHDGAQRVGATIIPASGGFTNRQIMLLRDFKATALTCTPSFAMHLAEVAKSEGFDPRKDFHLKAGIFGAEPSSEGLQRAVADTWGIAYHEIYGLSELIGPGVSCSCEQRNGLHLNEDHFYPEIIDPKNGEVLPYGELGELVLTSITKQALPIIRYRTGDLTRLRIEPCRCGRTLVRMESITGRADDMLIVNGVNIFPSQVEHVIAQAEGLTLNYQIIADKKGYLDRLEIHIEVDENIMTDSVGEMERLKRQLEKELLNHLYINADVKLVEPRSIERSMGKAVRVVDKRKI